GDYVAKHVVGDDDIELARIAHHLHAERVHVHVLRFDLRILCRHFFEYALPQAAGVRHGVRLVAHQHSLARRTIQLPVAGAVFKRVADDALDTLARVDVFLDRNFVGRSLLENSSEVAVNALGIFANHDEIHVFWFDAFERAQRRIQQSDWADIGVEVHLAAHAQQDFLRMNVRGHARIAEGPDQDGVEIPGQGREAVRWYCNFVGEIAVGSPVERGQFDCSTSGFYDFYSLRNNFFSDPVTGNHRNTLRRTHARNVSTGAECLCRDGGLPRLTGGGPPSRGGGGREKPASLQEIGSA